MSPPLGSRAASYPPPTILERNHVTKNNDYLGLETRQSFTGPDVAASFALSGDAQRKDMKYYDVYQEGAKHGPGSS
jgi:hypothetical protein